MPVEISDLGNRQCGIHFIIQRFIQQKTFFVVYAPRSRGSAQDIICTTGFSVLKALDLQKVHLWLCGCNKFMEKT